MKGHFSIGVYNMGDGPMKTLIAIFITLCVGLICSSAYADNTDIGSPENPVEFSDWNPQQFEHEDADPWKGWAFV